MRTIDDVMRALEARDGEARDRWRQTVQTALEWDDETFRNRVGESAYSLTRALWRMALEEASRP